MLGISLGLYTPIFGEHEVSAILLTWPEAANLALRVGTSTDLAFYTAAIISGASLIGRIVVPLLADTVGVRACSL